MTEISAPAPTSVLLQIYREPILPGSEAAYDAIEPDIVRVFVELGCPNPYLGLRTVNPPYEAWWVNEFSSVEHRDRVGQQYQEIPGLFDALTTHVNRKRAHVGEPLDSVARYRPDLSRGPAWNLAGARFVAAAMTSGDIPFDGAVFDVSDERRFVLRTTATHEDAAEILGSSPEAILLAVEPHWGYPSSAWINADPDLWRVNHKAASTKG